MIYRLLLIFIVLISFAFFSNIFLKGPGRKLFKTLEKTLLGMAISIVLFLVLGFLLEGPLTSSKYIITTADGILIGWIVSLFKHLSEAE